MVNYLADTPDFVSPGDFDGIEVISEQLIRTAHYYKLRCVSCNKKTIVMLYKIFPKYLG